MPTAAEAAKKVNISVKEYDKDKSVENDVEKRSGADVRSRLKYTHSRKRD